jgi:hypothetical protein
MQYSTNTLRFKSLFDSKTLAKKVSSISQEIPEINFIPYGEGFISSANVGNIDSLNKSDLERNSRRGYANIMLIQDWFDTKKFLRENNIQVDEKNLNLKNFNSFNKFLTNKYGFHLSDSLNYFIEETNKSQKVTSESLFTLFTIHYNNYSLDLSHLHEKDDPQYLIKYLSEFKNTLKECNEISSKLTLTKAVKENLSALFP